MVSEGKILNAFIKYMGDKVKGLNLFVALSPDCWPNDDNTYTCEVMQKEDNGKVWTCVCTKSGKIKDVYEVF